MKTRHALLVAALLASAAATPTPGIAQGCSGGDAGGIDATGNECTAEAAAATEVDPAVWALISSRLASAPSGKADTPASPAVTDGAKPASSPFVPGPGAGDIDSSKWAVR